MLGAEGREGAGEDLGGIWESGIGGIREGVEDGVGLGWESNERLCSRRDREGQGTRRRRDKVLPSACDQRASGFMRVCPLSWGH